MELKTCVVNQRAKHIARHVLRMHSHEHWIVTFDFAHHHRKMHIAVDDVLVSDGFEATIDSREICFHYATNEHLFCDAIPDQVGHRDHLEVVFCGKTFQLRQTSHRPVFIHHFADHSCGICLLYTSPS